MGGPTDDRTTPVVCEACGGDPEDKKTCVWCDRTGMLTPERYAQYRASRSHRITGQFQAWRGIVGDTIAILRERRTRFTAELADKGDALLEVYDRAFEPGSGTGSQDQRTKAVLELRAYHDSVISYLAGIR